MTVRPQGDVGNPARGSMRLALRSVAVAGVVVGVALSLAACGGDSQENAATSSPTVVQTVTVPPRTTTTTTTTEQPTQQAATPPPATSAPVEAGGSGGIMPSVVCMNLQAAQDLIQQNGVFFSRSHDATGQGRRQVLDRNWIVVEQSPAPGTPITEGDADLGAVKIGEPSQC